MKWSKRILGILIVLFVMGFMVPQSLDMPVSGATSADYHKDSFWYYPWGKSGTHKGIDIFASKGTTVSSSTLGVVVFTGMNGRGGNAVIVLGPKWRFHYYAHLNTIDTERFDLVRKGEVIGTVGTSGNAAGKPAHLHYTIATPIPYPWRIDDEPQGWRKMFYLDPAIYL